MGLFGKRNRKKLDTAEQQTRNTVQQPDLLASLSEHIGALAYPHSADRIADEIYKLAVGFTAVNV